jgi:hypothetical protein
MSDIDRPSATIYRFPVTSPSKISSPTEEAGAIPLVPADGIGGEVKESGRPFLQAARRNLTEEEAASPAGIRWLAHDVERLEQDCFTLRKEVHDLRHKHDALSEQYHDKRIEVEALRAVSRLSLKNEILANMCLAAGSAGLSTTPSYFSVPGASYLAIVGVVISAVLFIGGVALRMWK